MKKIKINNKLLLILMILLVILNLGGCMIDFSKKDNNNKKNYVCIEDYDPQLLVEESPESLQEFVKNHWDVVKEEVNNFTMERYGFRSEPTIVKKTGQAQSPTVVFIKSLEHEDLIFSMPASFNNEKASFGISESENELATLDSYLSNYLANFAYKDEIEKLNNELNSFIEEKGIYTYSEGLKEKLGFRTEFEIRSFSSDNLDANKKAYQELIEYFKNVKYENYSAIDIKKIIEGNYDNYQSEDNTHYVYCSVSIYNNYQNLDTKILEEFVNNCKSKGIELPAFRFSISNYYKMCMYTRGTFGSETSRVVFSNKFEITSSFNNENIIEQIKKLWGVENDKGVSRW